MGQLNSRSLQVLGTIIEEYISTASPVGSKTVAEHSGLKLSSASIRNSMGELTELGLLEQPHTSAGRVPTSRAFRLYIDNMLRPHPLSPAESQAIIESLNHEEFELNEILRRATSLVSAHCNQVSMLLAPERKSARWSGIGFTRSGRGKVLAVLALEGGMLETRLINTDIDFNSDELLRFGNYLNAHFKGMTLLAARQAIVDELTRAGRDLEKIFRQALTLGARTMQGLQHDERELFVEGTRTIFDQAEFANLESAREMFAFLEEKSRLLELLDAALTKSDVQVSFCDEDGGLPGCSVVSAPFGIRGASDGGQSSGQSTASGVVSIIGPSRMNYSLVMPVISCISGALTQILQARA